MAELKFIKSIRPCKYILIFEFLITIIFSTSSVVAYDEYEEIIHDLPVRSDFDHYLSALEKVVDFCIRYKHYVDLNLQFGLFLINMNLRQFAEHTETSIRTETSSRLEKLFAQNDVLADYFDSMIQKNLNDSKIGQNIKFALLFYNTSTWPRPPDKFTTDLLYETNIYSPKQLENEYGSWQKYQTLVQNFEEIKPSPAESDECIAVLVRAYSLHLYGRSLPNCLTPPRCKQVLLGDNQFGYGLTHRLLYLVIARFSRQCVVFSEKEDNLKTDMFCKKCFNEAEYIASNSFQLADLMYEQTTLCGLFGHVQFIRNYWVKTLLQFQTSEGCFSEKIATEDFDVNQMREADNEEWEIERQFDIMNGQCNGHFTGLAAATLSSALRYIIETYP